MKNKKSMETIQIAGTIIVTLLVVFVVSVILQDLFRKSAAEASDLLSSTKDCDNDGIANFYDKCPCDIGDEKNEGCPTGQIKTEGKKCKEKIRSNKC